MTLLTSRLLPLVVVVLAAVAACLASAGGDRHASPAPLLPKDDQQNDKSRGGGRAAAVQPNRGGHRGLPCRAGFHAQLHQVLATSKKADGVPILVPQTFTKPPPTWILISLTAGGAAQEKITLAVRNDNIYVAGFSNSVGTWYAFPSSQGLIKGSTTLPRKEDYSSLVGGHLKLPNYDVNKEAIIKAVRFLSAYKPSSDAGELGSNLARLIVIISEAARFSPIYNAVLQQQPRITQTEASMVVLWRDLSATVINHSKTKKWNNEEKFSKAGINGAEEAINALKILLLPKGVKPPAVVS